LSALARGVRECVLQVGLVLWAGLFKGHFLVIFGSFAIFLVFSVYWAFWCFSGFDLFV
jgi:hypothetical protein